MGSAWRCAHEDYNQTGMILKRIELLREVSPQVDRLLHDLSSYGNLILIGGAVRDLAESRTPRDYDIIVDAPDTRFAEAFSRFSYKQNRFGGYKLKVDGIEFDIWGIQSNWAFRERLLAPNFENISKGVFFNFDAVSFHLQWQNLDCTYFMEAINSRVLDILLDDEVVWKNPTPEVNVVRAWKIHKTRGLQFSDRLRNYIREWAATADNPQERLVEAERKHYGDGSQLSYDDYSQLLSHVKA
ncbi:hypothetical protein AV540_12600 [Brevibacillus parabrevis]|uniref:hypothetical protein n=1 Tax=Brevibacillus parabrevis TaxID=54914 RepID=UPI0007AB67E9|nr:hypothetical protein [Brevibacillus parabrevis]KZE51699.1 hypothetical protein AV540_12600 [Brevibacillus parabrevis]